jgi:hypothetical protein
MRVRGRLRARSLPDGAEAADPVRRRSARSCSTCGRRRTIIDLYDRERGNVRYEPTSAPWRAARPFMPGLLLGVAALVVVLLWKLHG